MQEEISEKLDWALAHLEKDDRMVWFVGILKRQLLAGCDPDSLPRKDLKKRAQALKFFGGERIDADYRDLIERFIPSWPHYFSLAENYRSSELEKFRFSQDQGKKQVPLSVTEVMVKLAECENSIVGKCSQSFCEDGEDFLLLDDGWKWVRVEDGYSQQEGLAMGHCGNYYSKKGDALYSLREPVQQEEEVRWRPHLTFICSKSGHFGEMKGRANGKPSSVYHDRITSLLSQPDFRGIEGGGYLPENNFSVTDLKGNEVSRIVRDNPSFELSKWSFRNTRQLIDFGDGWDWSFFEGYDLPKKPSPDYDMNRPPPLLLLRRKYTFNSRKTCLPILIFPYVRGHLGEPIAQQPIASIPNVESKFRKLLEIKEVKAVSSGSLFAPPFSWQKLLGVKSTHEVLEDWPGFSTATPLRSLLCRYAPGPYVASAYSVHLGDDLVELDDGVWNVVRFRSVRHFLESVSCHEGVRAFDASKHFGVDAWTRGQMKSQLLSFVDCFRFGLSGLYVVSEDPSSCSSPCRIVATEYAMARIEMDIGMASFENKFSLMSELVRTYDYERQSFQIAA
ncbi:MAG: hypothetical protein CMI29_10950 [Opitutae bacterium]|nr:hypothetical protein [Opitutae bacterium]